MGLLGDIRIQDWQVMSSFDCTAFVAHHLAVAVLFFDKMLRGFLDVIVKAGGRSLGLFGVCEAYYRMVEVQGRGTLHCHLLLWLKGNLNPQLLHDHMQVDDSYHHNVIVWLEANIKCKLPEQQGVVVNPTKLRKCQGEKDPCLDEYPPVAHLSENEFCTKFHTFVSWLAVTCN